MMIMMWVLVKGKEMLLTNSQGLIFEYLEADGIHLKLERIFPPLYIERIAKKEMAWVINGM